MVRYTDHITFQGRKSSLYILEQEAIDSTVCFKVHVTDTEQFECIFCRNHTDKWSYLPHKVQYRINELASVLILVIEERLRMQAEYFLSN